MAQSAKMNRRTYWVSIFFLPLFLAGGCTTPPQEDGPLTRDDMRALLARAKNPRSLYLTVFEGPAGPEFENAHRVHLDQVTQEPFIGANNQPCIITVRGSSSTPITALLDPSTPESWASLEMKTEIPLTPLGPPYYQVQAAHLAHTEAGFLTCASAIKINTVLVDSSLFTIRNHTGGLGPFAREVATSTEEEKKKLQNGFLEAFRIKWPQFKEEGGKSKVDIVLGHQFLQAFSFVRFDYPEQTVSFSTTRAFPSPGSKLLVKLPLHVIKGALGTEALINGQETKVLLDLAGNYSVAVPEDRAGKDLDLYLGDLALSGLEPFSFESLGLTESGYPRLGWQAIRQFVITLDYQRQVIWFERP